MADFDINADITDDDLATLLREITEDIKGIETVEPESINTDATHGATEVATALGIAGDVSSDLLPGSDAPELPREEILAGLRGAAEPVHDYPPEPEDDIDPSITTGDMLAIMYTELKRRRIAGPHIDSMNSFFEVGIKQIATKVFSVDGRMRNLRDKTDEDQRIAEIAFSLKFTDIDLNNPATIRSRTNAIEPMTPNAARLRNQNYSAQMYISAKIVTTAFFKDGTQKVREAEFKSHRIGAIPCLLKSKMCITHNMSHEALKQIEEDPLGTGGYFIIKGTEWTVDNLENITNNSFHVYRNMYDNEIARGAFLSKPGDAYENSYQVILRYLNTGSITIEITTNKTDKFEIPFYLIFRALGMTSDREIVDHIVYGVDNTDPVTTSIKEILDAAFRAEDPKFGSLRNEIDSAKIITEIGLKIAETANAGAAKKDDNIARYFNTSLLNIIDRYIFPHIGTDRVHRIPKLRMFGHLINKLLCVELGVAEQTDRDSLKNKRIFAAGASLAKAFKTNFNLAIVMAMKKKLIQVFKSTPFSNVPLADTVKSAINSKDLENALAQSITAGNKTITVKRNEITNRVSSQTVYHKNDMNVKSTANTVNTANAPANKQNERADEMRRVHPSFQYFIDPSQSADTGEKVGTTKQLACTASISAASDSFLLRKILESDPDIMILDKVAPAQISAQRLAKVFVNGLWIGCCRRSHEIAARYRAARRHGKINHTTTIVWEPLLREIYFWTDVGRLIRPSVIVYNNMAKYIDNRINGDKTVKFRQWIKLKRSHIMGLFAGKTTMDDLRHERVIEYISPDEQENCLIAPSIDDLRAVAGDLRMEYTHCDIEQAMFGIVTLAAPMANHSNAVRNTYYTNHRKQSAGWYSLAYAHRIDKNCTLQWYCEYPLISAFSDMLTYPNGTNCVVALTLNESKTCEDSLEVNQGSIDCGAFNATYYVYEKDELGKNERFGNPDIARTMDIKRDAIYEHVQNGFIKPGTLVQKGYVLIVKAATLAKPIDQFIYSDRSIVYKGAEPAIVDQVVTTRNDEDVQIAKVKMQKNRPLGIGDKLSTRTGNKGIVSSTAPRCDMLYTEDGLIVDINANCHSIPTRMAINQITECTLAQLAIKRGTHIDGTIFRKYDIDAVLDELKKHGVNYGGHRRAYNGKTGEWMDVLVFIGITTYQRLQKFVMDEHYAIRTGPTSALTRQPVDGKQRDGGLRLGEMERDVICGHGTMRMLYDKFYKDSDGVTVPICRCGERAIQNERMGIYRCKYCGDNADITNVAASWAANVFWQEASAMNVKMRMRLAPHIYLKKGE